MAYLPLDEPAPLQPSPLPATSGAGGYSVAGMGFSILGGLLKGMSDIQAAGFNAGTARQNAHLAELRAGDAQVRGQYAAAYAMLRGGDLVGKQKAAYASSGVSVSSGSAQDVIGDTKMMTSLDAKIIQNNAAREAWGLQTQAAQFKQQAQIDEVTGRQQATSDVLGGISGAASFGSKMIGLS